MWPPVRWRFALTYQVFLLCNGSTASTYGGKDAGILRSFGA